MITEARRTKLVSATDLATEEIRNHIHSRLLNPGDRIDIDGVAGELGISRTPIRDALHSLSSEGLVEILPRIGIFVRVISEQEATEVYALKAAVEPLAAMWAAERASATGRERLQEIWRDMGTAAGRGDVKRYAELVERFHSFLFELSESEVLQKVYLVTTGRVRMLRMLNLQQPGRLQDSLKQHGAVVQAVLAGDGHKAGSAMREHMQDAARLVRNVLASQAAVAVRNDDRTRSKTGARVDGEQPGTGGLRYRSTVRRRRTYQSP